MTLKLAALTFIISYLPMPIECRSFAGGDSPQQGLVEKIPIDAVELIPKSPLQNGEKVTKKIRKIFVFGKLKLDSSQDHIIVPPGTRLWKDFYFATRQGLILIERRMLLKLEKNVLKDADSFFGWSFVTAHFLPSKFSEVSGPLYIDLQEFPLKSFDLSKRSKLSMHGQSRRSETILRLADGRQEYIFPGKVMCHTCHGGAPGIRSTDMRSGSDSSDSSAGPTLSFLLQPGTLTKASIAALEEKGWLEPGVADFLTGNQEAIPIDDLSNQFQDLLHNNCLSCHNESPLAAARFTNFRLNPRRKLNFMELTSRLSEIETYDGYPLAGNKTHGGPVVVGDSAISRRIFKFNSAQMPPENGGVPTVRESFKKAIFSWIEGSVSLQHMVQAVLRHKGFEGRNGKPLVIDGNFGRPRRSNSYFALKSFQTQVGIPQISDFRDPKTIRALKIMP